MAHPMEATPAIRKLNGVSLSPRMCIVAISMG